MPNETATSFTAAPQAAEDDQFAVNYWKRRFNARHPASTPAVATLDIEYNELAKSWKTFQQLLPPTDQVSFEERPQTAQDVKNLVRNIQAIWASSSRQQVFGRSTGLCDDFLATVDSHTAPLTTLPGCRFYSSLFYGALQSIVKASANYPEIMAGVMKALAKINQALIPAEGVPLLLSKDSIPSIAKFYYLTFFFLEEWMDWYTRRAKCRVLQSPNEDGYLDFCGLISRIQGSAREFIDGFADTMDLEDNDCERTQSIMQHTDFYLWEQARLSQIGRQGRDRRFAAQNAMTRLLIWEIQRDADERLKVLEKRGQLLSRVHDQACQRLRPAGEQNSGIAHLTTPGQDPACKDTPGVTAPEAPRHKYTRVELQLASAHLQDHFGNDDLIADFQHDTEIIAEDNVISSLEEWATDTRSRILVVGRSSTTTLASPVALISACYANLLRDAKLPVIAHFCSLPTTAAAGMTTLLQQGLLALVYSLIRQLIDYLPPVSNGTSTFSLKAERFAPLKGTFASWKEVLSLIDTLLYCAPPLLVCIVDGLDKLQDPSTDEYIRSLVRTLVRHTRRQPDLAADDCRKQGVLLKILLTVSGQPSSLIEMLSENTPGPSELNEGNPVVPTDLSSGPTEDVAMMDV